MFSRKRLPVVMSIVLASAAIAFAQQPQSPAPDGSMRSDRIRKREGRGHDKIGRQRGRELRAMHELNLTEEQRLQQRAIAERYVETIKSKREELFKLRDKRMQGTFTADDEARAKALREEIDNSRQSMHTEIEGILTAEQRTKLEQIKTERKSRHEEMRKRHQEREINPQQ